MSDSKFFKWLIISTILHFAVLAAFSIPMPKSTRKINLSSYSVSLVGDMGGGPKTSGEAGMAKGVEAPVKEPPKPAKKAEPKKAEVKKPPREKPVKPKPVRPQKDEVSLAKKKAPVKEQPKTAKKETPTRDELAALNERLKQIKRRTDYVDISRRGDSSGSRGAGSGAAGLPFAGEGSGRPLDLATQKYYMDIRDKIKAAWRMPGSALKKLETEVTIKLRKDGRLVDVSVDRGSGSRVYDESVMRALKAAEPYPPIPSSLNLDAVEIPFRFNSEDMS